MPHRATELLELAETGRIAGGGCQCYFCGAACSGLRPLRRFLKPTFTDFDAVQCPSSDVVCGGCELAFREKIQMAGRDKPQKFRNYSWVITALTATPLSKAEIPALRAACMAPPDPPYAIVIAVSGQKHVAFKTPVCHDARRAVVCMEGRVVSYHVDDLADRIDLAARLAAVVGKPSLSGPLDVGQVIRIADAASDDGVAWARRWNRIVREPLAELAAFLCPSKKENNSCPETPSAASSTD